MSNLVPALVPLDKGLNLQSAKITAPPGSVLNCLNYEQVDFQGQKRIDGYTRYDGHTLAILDDWLKITLQITLSVHTGDFISSSKGVYGIALHNEASLSFDMAVINPNNAPSGDDLTIFKTLSGPSGAQEVASSVNGVDTGLTPAAHQAKLLTYNTVLRNRVGNLPGTAIALHWFRDRLYAVADVLAIVLTGTTPGIFPNDLLTVSTDPDLVETKVLDSFLIPNDTDDGFDRMVLLDTLDTESWNEDGADVLRGVEDMGTVFKSAYEIDQLLNMASFYESRSDLQVLDEDGPDGPYVYGWRFKDLGWAVNFKSGLSLFGSLPSINQNIQGVGTQGPTPVSGDNGKPLNLTQNVAISNANTQVNGWKSSSTPESYVLTPSDVWATDSDFTYADAFIQWDGTTGTVTAPGLNTPALTEYPATATVVITL